MKIGWKNLSDFIKNTKLYNFVNYIELIDGHYVWIYYQGETFSCMLSKGTHEYEEFENDIMPLSILKSDIANDGQTLTKIRHVMDGRYLNIMFVVFTTSTLEHNDTTGYFKVCMLDEEDKETTNSDDAVKTIVDFEPPFTYEAYGGGIQTLEDMKNESYYVSAIMLPHIPEEQGGMVYNIRNKLLVQPREEIFRGGFGAVELPYDATLHTNCIRIMMEHAKGEKNKFQLEMQYYK